MTNEHTSFGKILGIILCFSFASFFLICLIGCQPTYGQDILQKIELPDVIPESPKVKNRIIIFTADWCGSCKLLLKLIDDKDVNEKLHSKYDLYIIDVDKYKDYTKLHGVESVPTTIITNKKKERKRLIGYPRSDIGAEKKMDAKKFFMAWLDE